MTATTAQRTAGQSESDGGTGGSTTGFLSPSPASSVGPTPGTESTPETSGITEESVLPEIDPAVVAQGACIGFFAGELAGEGDANVVLKDRDRTVAFNGGRVAAAAVLFDGFPVLTLLAAAEAPTTTRGAVVQVDLLREVTTAGVRIPVGGVGGLLTWFDGNSLMNRAIGGSIFLSAVGSENGDPIVGDVQALLPLRTLPNVSAEGIEPRGVTAYFEAVVHGEAAPPLLGNA
ncbi:MAG: hypothetical protein D6812_17240, partial [Deltaproteobacteria bacterium]